MVEAHSRPRAAKQGLEARRRSHPDGRLTAAGQMLSQTFNKATEVIASDDRLYATHLGTQLLPDRMAASRGQPPFCM
jgi:hypothetical protein